MVYAFLTGDTDIEGKLIPVFLLFVTIRTTVAMKYAYIIGHYNPPSVRIIDLVSHTTYVVCVNFIYKWQDLQFKVDSER